MATLTIKSTSLKDRLPRLKVKQETLADVVDKLEPLQNNLQLVPESAPSSSEEIQEIVVKPAKKKRKVPVDVPGNQSIYWFSNNRKLDLSQEQLRTDGHKQIENITGKQ
jgi:membrane carboxypeptidase/penicillin-binding protein PbpC